MQFLALLVCAVVLVLVMLWWLQEKILFQPPGNVDYTDAGAKRIEFVAADGQQLFGYLVGDVEDTDVVLAFHGNADLAVWQLGWASEIVRRFGVGVFLAEYRGYGGGKGKPTYASSSLDAEASYLCLTQQLGAQSDGITFFGHSLGSAVASELASRHAPHALILQSPFTSAREMARLTLASPLTLLWNLVSRIHFDVVAIVQTIDAPVSVIHGTRDLVIPARMGEAVYRAAKVKGAFALIEKAGHNNVVDVAGENYWKWFASALHRPIAESAGR